MIAALTRGRLIPYDVAQVQCDGCQEPLCIDPADAGDRDFCEECSPYVCSRCWAFDHVGLKHRMQPQGVCSDCLESEEHREAWAS
jgi:hypothetical protein